MKTTAMKTTAVKTTAMNTTASKIVNLQAAFLRNPRGRMLGLGWLALGMVVMSAGMGWGQERRELFDGTSLKGWEGVEGLWTVEEGAITGITTAEKPIANNTFLVWKDGVVGDFELTLEYRIQGGNSGIQYRSKLIDAEKKIVGGYQADIDSNGVYTGINYEERGRGILAERGQIVRIDREGGKQRVGSAGDKRALMDLVKSDGWNRYRVVARGGLCQHYINDVLMSEVLDEQSVGAKEGILAFQLHQGPPMKVQFRSIVLSGLR